MNKDYLKKKYYYLSKKKNEIFIFMEDQINNPIRKRKTVSPTKYIHIGYPKAASTALQKGFFGRHNQLYHLGCGAKKNQNFWDDHGYIDGNINIALEIDLRYRNNFAYDENKVKEIFEKHFQIAVQNKNIHAIGISNENICFNWHGGIDTTEKAKRLNKIFGKDTKIIMILRNQKSLIESLYKESIRFGYPGTFYDYLNYLWTYKDRNFLYDFCYDKVYKLYADLFGIENVQVFFFEEFQNNQQKFRKELSKALDIDYYNLPIREHFNKQLDAKALYIKQMLNKKYPHTFSKGVYSPSDTHRFAAYFNFELNQEVPFEDYFDYYVRQYLSTLSNFLPTKVEVPEINLKWDSELKEKILGLYQNSNAEIQKKLNLNFDDWGYTNLIVKD